MNDKTIIEFGFCTYEELWTSRRVLSALADNTLLDLHNFSDDTQPHPIIVIIIHSKYFSISDWLKSHA